MTIRRVDSGPAGPGGIKRSGGTHQKGGAEFSSFLDSVAAVQGAAPTVPVDGVGAVGEEGSRGQRQEHLEQAGQLLDSLEGVSRQLGEGKDPTTLRDQLRHSRDSVLTSINNDPATPEERELLHRTAVLASVELAKSDRGDYS